MLYDPGPDRGRDNQLNIQFLPKQVKDVFEESSSEICQVSLTTCAACFNIY